MASSALRMSAACALICFLLAAPGAEAAISCGAAVGAIVPCLSFVSGKATKPLPSCCSGVKRLNSMATTTASRRASCACLKGYSTKIKGLIGSRVSAIPGACGVSLRFSISPSTNCNTIP